jgi:hypothetical protein
VALVLADPEDNTTRSTRLAPDTIAIAVLVSVLAVFYWGFLTGKSFIGDDTENQFYPGVNYFAKSIQSGRFPLWFPGVHDGQPFYSDPQMAVFYPPQWLLIPFVTGGRLPCLVYQRYIFLHYVLGGLFMYVFLRQIKRSPIAALCGALVFCLSGFASLRIVNFVMMQVYVWLPLQLLCVHHLTTGKTRWAWPTLVVAMVMSLMAGHQQTTVYCWYLVIAYWLCRDWHERRGCEQDWWTALRQVIGRGLPKMLGTFALVFGIGAVMLLPAAENWLRTVRSHQSFDAVADTSVPYHQLLTLLVPNFFGLTQPIESPVPFWGFDVHSWTVTHNGPVGAATGFWQYWEFGAYAGEIFWVALALVLFNWRHIEDKFTVGFFVAVWVGAVWFMLGRFGGLFQLLYHVLPGASVFRGPAKMSCVATIAAAILTAYAVDLVRHRVGPIRWWPALLPVAGCVCLVGVLFCAGGQHLAEGFRNPNWLNWSRRETAFALEAGAICSLAALGVIRARRQWLQTLCLCIIPFVTVADFYHAYGAFHRNPVSPDTGYPQSNGLLSVLEGFRQRLGPFRFGQISDGRLTEEIVMLPNLAYFHDFLEVPEGYTSFCLESVSDFRNITNEEAKIALQNIRLALERDPEGKDWIGQRTNSFPRAKFFSRVRRYESRATLLKAVENDEIDWRNEAAVCDLPATVDLSHWATNTQPAAVSDEVQFESGTPESYSIHYHLSRPGIIFVSEAYYPGWGAMDPRLKLVEVFGAFQGLVVPEAGQGDVVVRFSPSVARWGCAISLLSCAVFALLVIRKRSRRSSIRD